MANSQVRNEHLVKLVMAGLTAALAYVVFTFLRINIPLPGGGQTSIHFGNAVVVLGAALIGGVWGGVGGAIGLSIGDLFDPKYVVEAPKTFLMKLAIGLIAGLIAHKLFKITKTEDPKKYFVGMLVAAAGALIFNAIFDPLVGYFYKLWILGRPAADLTLAWNYAATIINSVSSTIISTAVYMALRPALKAVHLLPKVK